LGGVSVAEVLSEVEGREITPHSPEEDEVMEDLIRDAAFVIKGLFADTGVEVVAELHDTDRVSGEQASKLSPINLGLDKPRQNVATFKRNNAKAIEAVKARK
jgi:hypothetical protein